MPKRKYKSREKINSEEVQGKGSWVVIRRPTWEDFEQAMNGNKPDEDPNEIQMGKKIIENLVDEWNWVDDDDQPLGEPEAEIIRTLPFQEMQFLIEHLDLEGLDQKNSPKRSGSTSSQKRQRRSTTSK